MAGRRGFTGPQIIGTFTYTSLSAAGVLRRSGCRKEYLPTRCLLSGLETTWSPVIGSPCCTTAR